MTRETPARAKPRARERGEEDLTQRAQRHPSAQRRGECPRNLGPSDTRLEPTDRDRLSDLLLTYLARDPLPRRPNRTEPRARKRRPKNYQLLTQPRRIFKEIPHRDKYRRP